MKKSLSEMTLEELWKLFPIIICDHNPEYEQWYLRKKEEIENTIGLDIIERINHIGSTAIEGLKAKPTVDILLEVDINCDMKMLKSTLINAGWGFMAYEEEPYMKMSLNYGYTPDGFAERVFHLHVRYLGDWDELYFRDYLLTHKEVTREYGELKQKLKEKFEHNRDGYTEAKTWFIKKWTEQARKEFPDRYKPDR